MRIVPTAEIVRGGVRLGLLVAGLLWANSAYGQLRVVSYNTAGGINDDLEVVLRAIGEEEINGIAKPIDVLLLQEQQSPASDTQSIREYLNSIPGYPFYSRGTLAGGPAISSIRQTIIYNTETVQLVAESKFGDISSSNAQERETLRYQLRPVGYGTSADFYAYNSHYSAGTSASEQLSRETEALQIRANYNSLGDGTHAIYAGDMNVYTSTEPAFEAITDPSLYSGAGQAFDPINQIGDWHDNVDFAPYHTQSPCRTGCSGTPGGMDDRFDWQLVTDEFLDEEGLSYITGSYRAFGNNGVSFGEGSGLDGDNINNAANLDPETGYPFDGVTTYTRTQVLNALKSATDHIPVVVDYQVPAMLRALADSVPATLSQGEPFSLEVSVSNAADVVAAIGADELDYALTTSGDVSGSFLGQMALALDAGNMHLVGFDTSTPGMKTGTISVSSSSQAVANAMDTPGMDGSWTMDIEYEVLAAALIGDYNGDDVVDAADYTVWRDAQENGDMTLTNRDPANAGLVDEDDYDSWRSHFGWSLLGAGGGASAAPVPEPSTLVMLLLASICLAPLTGGRLGSWTRKR